MPRPSFSEVTLQQKRGPLAGELAVFLSFSEVTLQQKRGQLEVEPHSHTDRRLLQSQLLVGSPQGEVRESQLIWTPRASG